MRFLLLVLIISFSFAQNVTLEEYLASGNAQREQELQPCYADGTPAPKIESLSDDVFRMVDYEKNIYQIYTFKEDGSVEVYDQINDIKQVISTDNITTK